MKKRPDCDKPIDDGVKNCPDCNTDITQEQSENTEVCEQPKRKSRKKLLIFGIPAVCLLLATAIVLSVFPTKKPSYLLYIRDGELMFTSTSRINPIQITTEQIQPQAVLLDNANRFAKQLNDHSVITENGKYIFYYDKYDDIGHRVKGTLYYRNLKKPKEEPIKIDDFVNTDYFVNKSGDTVIYLSSKSQYAGGTLYISDLNESKKISSDVLSFVATADGKTILYSVYTEENESMTCYSLYIKKGDAEPERICKNAKYFNCADENLKTVYYSEGDAYYKWDGEKSVKLLDNIVRVVAAYETGEAYYLTKEEKEIDAMTYINDDMGDDGKSIREQLKEEKISNPVSTLCYFDGEKSTVLTDSYVARYYTEVQIEGKTTIVYVAYESDAKLNMSKLKSADYAYSETNRVLNDNGTAYVAVKGNIIPLDCTKVENVTFDKDYQTMYYVADSESVNNTLVGTLCSVKLTAEGTSDITKIDTEVDDTLTSHNRYYGTYTYLYYEDILNDKPIYFKNYNKSIDSCDLYVNGDLIDESVYLPSIHVDEDGNIAYITDYDSESMCGTLRYYGKDGNLEKIDTDVAMLAFAPDGGIAYITDYDTDSCEGDLYLYKVGGKPKKVDIYVSHIIETYKSVYADAFYGW